MAPNAGIQPSEASATHESSSLLAASGALPHTQRIEETRTQNGGYGTVCEATASHNASETDSLLKTNGEADGEGHGRAEDEDKPLRMGQIFVLCLARMVDPVSFFCIFPFINQMIFETGGVEEVDVGFYSGLIESLFSLCQVFTMIIWGRASDRFGRKPILVVSLIGCGLTVSLFGFSRTIPQMIVFRCLAGVFSGTVVTIRAMITENSTKRTQARAFSLFAVSTNLGFFVGPVIGGGLSKLSQHYPKVFGGNRFLEAFPYALPTLVVGGFSMLCAVVVALFVRETLDKNELDKKGQKIEPMSTWELIKSKGVPFVLYLYSAIGLVAFAYTAVAPVFWFEPPTKGGFGFDERLISLFLSIAGISQALWLLLVFPPLQHRIGTGGVLRLCLRSWPFFFLLNPVCNWLLRKNLRAVFWAVGPLILVIGSGVAMCFTAVQLALNDVSPSPHVLGTLNALVLSLSSGIRTFAPAVFTSLYAMSLRKQILWGHLIWVIMLVMVVGLAISLRWLPKKVEDMPAERQTIADDEIQANDVDERQREEGEEE